MLELRPSCENCGKLLPPSAEARICSLECTFCATCVDGVLKNVCPNCGGGFEPRPVRPKHSLRRYPATTEVTLKPVDPAKQSELIAKLANIAPTDR